jgi:pimeloyl-ACP methyl ester carboxylesterase
MTLLAPKQSASPNFSYFYRPHKSEKHRPIILVHGVGIGLPVYIPLMMKIPKDIGVLAIEILPISSRITTSIPLFIDLMREVGDIVSQQNLQDFVFIGHSYGTFFTKVFLESTYLSSRMHSIVLMDPVAVLLHLPDLAYNFFVKEPKEANELQLWWAAQTEPDIAFTLTRRFCWHDHVVWREDLMDKPTTIVIGEKDCIVNSDAIASYITKGVPEADAASIVTKPDLTWNWEDREKWKRSIEEWKGEGLELFWMEGYDHGQAFLSPKMLSKLVNIFEKICKVEGSNEKMTEEEEENVQQFEFEPESKPEPDINGSGIRDV